VEVLLAFCLAPRFHLVQGHKEDELLRLLEAAAADEWLAGGAQIPHCSDLTPLGSHIARFPHHSDHEDPALSGSQIPQCSDPALPASGAHVSVYCLLVRVGAAIIFCAGPARADRIHALIQASGCQTSLVMCVL
jgi:hypothetical protein